MVNMVNFFTPYPLRFDPLLSIRDGAEMFTKFTKFTRTAPDGHVPWQTDAIFGPSTLVAAAGSALRQST